MVCLSFGKAGLVLAEVLRGNPADLFLVVGSVGRILAVLTPTVAPLAHFCVISSTPSQVDGGGSARYLLQRACRLNQVTSSPSSGRQASR